MPDERFATFDPLSPVAAPSTSRRSIHATRLAALVFALAALPAFAQSCRVASEAMTRPLVELYTSEGCNSCPPADRWLARQFPAASENSRAVALAFHVDYWDRLGWVDRFASALYTERQYAAMRADGATFVYTPQVLLQGHDLPGWAASDTDAAIARAARTPSRASIEVEIEPNGAALRVHARARIPDAALQRDAQLFIAYADSGLQSEVRAGENRGVRLTHEHVVRSLRAFGPPDPEGRIDVRADVARPAEAGTAPTLVAFVQRTSNAEVLQVLPVPIDRCAPG